MSGFGITIDSRGIDQLNATLDRLSGIDTSPVLGVMGRIVEDQTINRIKETKASPDGELWPEWSDEYAATRHSNQSLLESQGHLVDSMQSVEGLDSVEVGTNLEYARSHQYGDPRRGIPQREFLGVGAGDVYELQETLERWYQDEISRL